MVASANSDLSLWSTTPSDVLLARADELRARRRWKPAMKLLAVAETKTGDEVLRRTILERLAVTAADAGSHRISTEAVFALDRYETKTAATWVAIAEVALARANFAHADSAGRKALERQGDHADAWMALASSFAGLGWFEESDRCLGEIGGTDAANPAADHWRLGRATNQWAMTRTWALPAAALAAFVVGWLAVAVAVGVPLLTRRARLRRLADRHPDVHAAAVHAWRHERRLRLLHGAAIVASVAAFAAATIGV